MSRVEVRYRQVNVAQGCWSESEDNRCFPLLSPEIAAFSKSRLKLETLIWRCHMSLATSLAAGKYNYLTSYLTYLAHRYNDYIHS